MKKVTKLQNNFTTPERSKSLLKLGVPRWSADEYRDQKGYRHSLEGILDVELFFKNFPDYSPCWSVGRLIEIICNCHVVTNQLMENWICCDKNTDLIELLIRDIEVYTNVQHMDFLKLEE